MEAPPPRRRRRDFGSIRLNDRDLRALGIVAEHWAVQVPRLGEVLTHFDPRGLNVSAEAARKVVSRWHRAGLVETGVILSSHPPYVWATSRGLHTVGREHYRPLSPAAVTLPHLDAVLRVRIAKGVLDPSMWVSERALRSAAPRNQTGTRVHFPDGEALVQSGRIAIEVELTSKGRRAASIVMELLTRRDGFGPNEQRPPSATPRYDGVAYFAAPDAMTSILRVRDTLPGELAARLHVEALP